MDPLIATEAAQIALRAERDLEALVAVSSPSGDLPGAEEALAVCAALLPPEAAIERVPCSTAGGAPDFIATITGSGTRRLMLLGHVDTVIAHESHGPLKHDGDRLYGPGTADMKGGDVLALGVARTLAARPELFAELAVLFVTDEEWRIQPFTHVERFAGYDACLCFEAGERTAQRRGGRGRPPQGGRARSGWSRGAGPRTPAARPTAAETRSSPCPGRRSRSPATTTRRAPTGSASSRPSCARAMRSTSCPPTGS